MSGKKSVRPGTASDGLGGPDRLEALSSLRAWAAH